MGRSNGQKAQQKRERNMKKQAGANKANSTLKTRDQALTIKCELCLTPFMGMYKELTFPMFLRKQQQTRIATTRRDEAPQGNI